MQKIEFMSSKYIYSAAINSVSSVHHIVLCHCHISSVYCTFSSLFIPLLCISWISCAFLFCFEFCKQVLHVKLSVLLLSSYDKSKTKGKRKCFLFFFLLIYSTISTLSNQVEFFQFQIVKLCQNYPFFNVKDRGSSCSPEGK